MVISDVSGDISDVSGNAVVGVIGPYASEVCHQLQYGSTPARLQRNRSTDDAGALALYFVV